MNPQKRVRPYIPIEVRLRVVLRQLGLTPEQIERRLLSAHHQSGGEGHGRLLARSLAHLGIGGKRLQLDHDPALILRPYNARIRDVAARYTPNANDPDFLIYREADQHLQKTTGRRPGAERTITTKGSDVGLKTKFAKLEGRTKPRPKAKIPQRRNPWGTKPRNIRS